MDRTEEEVYSLLQSDFKDIYADLIMVVGYKPREILFELEATLSHLAVAKTKQDYYQSNINKAYSHIQRATLDSVKLLWIEYKERLSQFIKDEDLRRYCARTGDNEFLEKYQFAEDKAKNARRTEIQNVGVDPMASINEYYEAANMYKDLWDSLDPQAVIKYKRFNIGNVIKSQGIGFIVGVVAGIVGNILFNIL